MRLCGTDLHAPSDVRRVSTNDVIVNSMLMWASWNNRPPGGLPSATDQWSTASGTCALPSKHEENQVPVVVVRSAIIGNAATRNESGSLSRASFDSDHDDRRRYTDGNTHSTTMDRLIHCYGIMSLVSKMDPPMIYR
jgi:hypothetical protein